MCFNPKKFLNQDCRGLPDKVFIIISHRNFAGCRMCICLVKKAICRHLLLPVVEQCILGMCPSGSKSILTDRVGCHSR